ncbi:nitrogen fixation protein nifU [Fusobacterium sp. CAG:439]|nr:nitrogen fixation protein nifU [Fusobacterium sp. CAG:439]HIT92463.1 Fe-S cluster assembly protein NifU [Candidatus Stercorousia faecigallinarum]
MWDYSDKVIDHYRNPRNVGKIDNADAIGEAGSLACGDSLKIYLKINNGIVTDAKFQTFGCGSAVASSSILTEMIIGKTVDEVKKITNKDIADQLGGLPPEKMHCSVMGYEALEDALKNYDDFTDLDDIRNEEAANQKREKIVCTCFGITENIIWDAIKMNGLKTVEEITNYTKAGGACGKCKGLIQDIIDTYYKKEENEKAESTLSPAQKILKINNIIENQISPELRKDGGDITLVDIDGNKVMVKLRGKCSGCKNSHLTLKAFVESTLRDTVDKNIEVIEV